MNEPFRAEMLELEQRLELAYAVDADGDTELAVDNVSAAQLIAEASRILYATLRLNGSAPMPKPKHELTQAERKAGAAKTRVIRISNETFARLQTYAEPLRDTPDIAINKIIDLMETAMDEMVAMQEG